MELELFTSQARTFLILVLGRYTHTDANNLGDFSAFYTLGAAATTTIKSRTTPDSRMSLSTMSLSRSTNTGKQASRVSQSSTPLPKANSPPTRGTTNRTTSGGQTDAPFGGVTSLSKVPTPPASSPRVPAVSSPWQTETSSPSDPPPDSSTRRSHSPNGSGHLHRQPGICFRRCIKFLLPSKAQTGGTSPR